MGRRSFLKHSVSGAVGMTLGANDRIRIRLIGCGGRGNYLLAQTLRHAQSRNLEVVGLCDVWSASTPTPR